VKFLKKFSVPLPLKTLKQQPALADLALVRRGNRLSLMPVSAAQWQFILKLAADFS
jgi:predicted RNA-binding protein with PUA-like domain